MKNSLLICLIVFGFFSCKKEAPEQTQPEPIPSPPSYLEPYTGTYNGIAKFSSFNGGQMTSYTTGASIVTTLGQKDSTLNLYIYYANGGASAYPDLEMNGFTCKNYLTNDEWIEFEFANNSTFDFRYYNVESLAIYNSISITANK